MYPIPLINDYLSTVTSLFVESDGNNDDHISDRKNNATADANDVISVKETAEEDEQTKA